MNTKYLTFEQLDSTNSSWLDHYYARPCDDSYDHRYPQTEDFEEIEDDDDFLF